MRGDDPIFRAFLVEFIRTLAEDIVRIQAETDKSERLAIARFVLRRKERDLGVAPPANKDREA